MGEGVWSERMAGDGLGLSGGLVRLCVVGLMVRFLCLRWSFL